MTRSVVGLCALVAFALGSGAAMAGSGCSGLIVHAPTTKTVASAEGGSQSQTPIVVPGKGG